MCDSTTVRPAEGMVEVEVALVEEAVAVAVAARRLHAADVRHHLPKIVRQPLVVEHLPAVDQYQPLGVGGAHRLESPRVRKLEIRELVRRGDRREEPRLWHADGVQILPLHEFVLR